MRTIDFRVWKFGGIKEFDISCTDFANICWRRLHFICFGHMGEKGSINNVHCSCMRIRLLNEQAKRVWPRTIIQYRANIQLFYGSMTYLLFAYSATHRPHTRLTRCTMNTHILSGIKWRFKGELRCNGANNERHHHTRAHSHIVSVGRRCAVRNHVSRTKVNLVTAMFVYWHDTAADFTTPMKRRIRWCDGVLGLLFQLRSEVQVNGEHVCESQVGVLAVSELFPYFYCLETENVFPPERFCADRFINICTIDVHLMVGADCRKVATAPEKQKGECFTCIVQFVKQTKIRREEMF